MIDQGLNIFALVETTFQGWFLSTAGTIAVLGRTGRKETS